MKFFLCVLEIGLEFEGGIYKWILRLRIFLFIYCFSFLWVFFMVKYVLGVGVLEE